MDLETVGKLKVAELKKELEMNGLSTKGNKAELVERLKQHLVEASAQDTSVTEEDGGNILEESDLLGGEEEELVEDGENVADDVEPVVTESKPLIATTKQSSNVDDLTNKLNRAERFNVALSVSDKKAERAKRFGLQASTPTAGDDKKKARAERFGVVVSPTLAKSENLLKKQQRAERFGTTLNTNKTVAANPTLKASDDKLLKRKERFGISITSASSDAEAKKLKRAERFNLS